MRVSCVVTIAFAVSFNLIFQSQSSWFSMFRGSRSLSTTYIMWCRSLGLFGHDPLKRDQRSVEKRPTRMRLENEIRWNSKCNRLYMLAHKGLQSARRALCYVACRSLCCDACWSLCCVACRSLCCVTYRSIQRQSVCSFWFYLRVHWLAYMYIYVYIHIYIYMYIYIYICIYMYTYV